MRSPFTVVAVVVTVLSSGLLLATAPEEMAHLVGRLAPIFVFVAGMSVVVNIAAQVGTFDYVTSQLEKLVPRSHRRRSVLLWAGLVLISVIVTVFLSLDTTAILITPLAMALAARNGMNPLPVALAVVWLANIGSLLLPVSNLTNLLAVGEAGFTSTADYVSQVWVAGVVALLIAVTASWLVFARTSVPSATAAASETADPRHPLLPVALAVVAVLLPALSSPIPYWISSSVAAVILAGASAYRHPHLLSPGLIPWSSLGLATTMSVVATAVSVVGGAELVRGWLGTTGGGGGDLLLLAGAGAVASNLINNIPAYLALEPAATTTTGTIALLIGVNAGPLITPWASLATLLWHDQLRRAGVHVGWGTFIRLGLVLAPVAVLLPAAALMVQVT